MKKLFMILGALAVIGAAVGGGLYYAYPVQVSTLAGLTRNYVISLVAPAGSVTTELNAVYKGAETVASAAPADAPAEDWPSYNRTLSSERRSPLSQINTTNVGKLKVL
jgi:alcohol dehydrogenase (cytochrome c)